MRHRNERDSDISVVFEQAIACQVANRPCYVKGETAAGVAVVGVIVPEKAEGSDKRRITCRRLLIGAWRVQEYPHYRSQILRRFHFQSQPYPVRFGGRSPGDRHRAYAVDVSS